MVCPLGKKIGEIDNIDGLASGAVRASDLDILRDDPGAAASRAAPGRHDREAVRVKPAQPAGDGRLRDVGLPALKHHSTSLEQSAMPKHRTCGRG